MTYATDEASRESSNPIELYRFVGPLATYRRVSGNKDVDFNNGVDGLQTFTATPMSRSNLVLAPDGNAPEMTVIIPTSDAISLAYVFQVAPQELVCTIYRQHVSTGDFETYWEGPVTGFSVAEYEVTMRIPHPLKQLMEDKLPNIHYQPFCNNVLFDAVCSLVDTDHKETAQIDSISGDGKTITFKAAGGLVSAGRANSWANGGEILSSNGERRMVLTQTGEVCIILWPFSSDVSPDDFMTVFAGCNHSLDQCVNKFSNVDNFNGMPFILTQELNPTQGGTH